MICGEHRTFGDIRVHVTNISPVGFTVAQRAGMDRGDRILVNLPVVGRMEAFCIWKRHQQAGFQLERPIRTDKFLALIGALQGAHLRNTG
jgi:hypothetical protein